MRRAGLPKRQKTQLTRAEAQQITIKAPIGGLNTRDSLANMPPEDAIELVNMIPQQEGVISRNGYNIATGNSDFVFYDQNDFIFYDGNDFVFAEGAPAPYSGNVETIIPYVEGSTKLLITASDDVLYTDNGDGTLTSLGTGFGNARWEGVKLGANMLLCNGADAIQNFDGSSLTTPSFSGDLATYGVSNIDNAHKHKNRIYLWNTDDNVFFYGGVNAVAGSFDEFPLSRVSDTGGNLIEMKTISRDAGNGSDDYAAFILDTGEVLIYQGSDPSDASNWALVGKYKAPPIIAKRCATEFAGDVMYLSTQDIVKLSEVIKFGGETGGFVLRPSKLSGAIRNFFNTYGTNFGFSLTLLPSQSLIIANMPVVTNDEYIQYAINTVTGAATELNDLNFNCFGVLSNNLYGGSNQAVYNVLDGFSDDGAAISLSARGAFNNFGVSRKKYISSATLFIESEGELNIDFAMSYDFTLSPFNSTTSTQTLGAEWDTELWDEAEWAGAISSQPKFIMSGGGYNISPQLQTSISGQQINWYEGVYNFRISNTYP